MQLSEVETALAIVIGGGTIAGTIIGGLWKGRTVLTATCSYVSSWFKLPAQMAIVIREVTPNGGGSMRDIVVATQYRVAANEAFSHAILAQLHIPFWKSDDAGNCTFYSRELAMLTGWTPADNLGRGWLSTIYPDCREEVQEEWDACMRDGREFVMDYAFITPRGERLDVHAEANAMRDPKGKVIGYVGRVTRRGV